MVSSIPNFSPIRVDIRIVLRDGGNTNSEVTEGTIAPPSSPQEQVPGKPKRKEKHSIKRELHSLRLNTPKLHSEDYIKTKTQFAEFPRKLPQIAWKSPELERDSSASSDASKKSNSGFNNLQQRDRMNELPTSAHEKEHAPNTKCERILISPFSERRAARYRKKCSACQNASLQPPGSGYFRGKPALTPFTRLGCYRMQTSKSKLMFLSKQSAEETRCSTADVLRPATTIERKQRPYSQIPLKSYSNNHTALRSLHSSRSNQLHESHEAFSNRNETQFLPQDVIPPNTNNCKVKSYKPTKNSVLDTEIAEPDIPQTKSKETGKLLTNHDHPIKASNIPYSAKLQVKQNFTFTAPFYERQQKFNTTKGSIRKAVPKLQKAKQDFHLKKDTVIFYRKNTSKAQLSPFRRTMKINPTSINRLPPSTNTSVYIFD